MTSSWLKTPNKILVRQRLLEILVDYFVIVAYLLCLAMVAAIVYGLILDGIPAFSLWQSQLFVTVVSVVPVVVVFAYLDFREKSFGKRAAKLSLHFKTKKFWRSLVRNSVKFMPWQLAHMGVIDGMNSNFESQTSMIFIFSGLGLACILILMLFIRSDKRHLGDIVAGTQVVVVQNA